MKLIASTGIEPLGAIRNVGDAVPYIVFLSALGAIVGAGVLDGPPERKTLLVLNLCLNTENLPILPLKGGVS